MSHLIEEYAKNLGVKISKPIVSKHFWPLPHDNYITICADALIPSKQYKYYELVLFLLKQHLDGANIKVFQVGSSSSTKIANVDNTFFDISFKNTAYIISKSKLHIGSDEVYTHYADSISVPTISLLGHAYANVCGGFWSKKTLNIEAPWKVKPCFNVQDAEDAINKIKPEEVAAAILSQLNINLQINIKTKFIGNFFDKKIIEIVPNFYTPIAGLNQEHVFIRCDLGFDPKFFIEWMRYLNSFTLFTDKPFDFKTLSQIKSKMKNISFILEDNHGFSQQYFESVRQLNIPINILIKNEEKLGQYRNEFFDFTVDLYNKTNKKDLGDNFSFNNTYFMSSKTIFADNTHYPSKFHFEQKNKVDKSMKLLDNDALLEELPHFYIYETTR